MGELRKERQERQTQNKKGVLTEQGLLENEPLRVGTPLSGAVGRIRLWMPPA
jgi:hypothetical protein